MGWESRGDGHYYYRKVRCGHRVVSEYIGNGQVAEMVAQLAEADRDDARRRRGAERQAIQQAEAAHAEFVRISETLRHLTIAVLEQVGFHRHKGQWRRQRNERSRGHEASRDR